MTECISRDVAKAFFTPPKGVTFLTPLYFRQEDVIATLDNIPAADVREVVRGKWIADGDGYHWTYNCSICGWKDGYPFNERHNFCPNCGADMRGES